MSRLGGKGNNVLRLLETLLSAKIEPEEKKQILQNEFDIKMTQAFDKGGNGYVQLK